MNKRCILAAAFLVQALYAGQPSLAAETWPFQPMKIIVPLPAGSAADTIARLVSKELSEELHQSVIVVDQPGASGELGTTELAHSAPDGYTIGIATSTTLVTAPLLNPQLKYNPNKDLIPVAMIGYSPYVLVVNPKVPAKTIQEFIALAKKQPGQISYSSVGVASLSHLAIALFSSKTGVRLNEIPYKSSTQGVIDLLAGRIDSQFGILTTTHHFITEGKLRALGITTLKRVPDYPDLPTIAESGLPGYEASLWLGVVAPAKTPTPIVARLNAIINGMLARPETQKFLTNQALYADPMSPAQMQARVDEDFNKWKGVLAQK
jgi:tripartite-type tricarboxylate transporter receptor subunit TctC